MVLLLLLRPAVQVQVGKNWIVEKLLSQPQKQLGYGNQKNTQLREATNGWLLP